MDAAAIVLLLAPGVAASTVSLGDMPAWLMFGLAAAGQVYTLWRVGRDGQRKAVARGEKEAATEARQTAAMEELAKANGRVASALDSLDKWARSHELADAKWQSTMAEVQRQQTEALTKMVTAQENLQRQLTNVALHLAPADVEAVPANVPRRRR